MLARAAVALVALAMLGWLVILERDERLHRSGVVAAGQGAFERAESDLEAARLLNPDTAPDVSRAVLYEGAGELGRATALLEDVVAGEPDNRTAWLLLLGFGGRRDPELARRAEAALRRIDPLTAARTAPAGPR